MTSLPSECQFQNNASHILCRRHANSENNGDAEMDDPYFFLGLGGVNGSLVPGFPVVGLTFGFELQLSVRVLLGVVRAWGSRYVPLLVTVPRTRVDRCAKPETAIARMSMGSMSFM